MSHSVCGRELCIYVLHEIKRHKYSYVRLNVLYTVTVLLPTD